MMMGIGLTFPFISYDNMCSMELAELYQWYEEAKEYQEKLTEAQGG